MVTVVVLWSQALAGSSVSELAFGSPINASALLIILLHQVIESHTLVRTSSLTLIIVFVIQSLDI